MDKERRVTFFTRRFLVGRAGPFPRLVFREDVMLHLDQFAHLHNKGEHGGFLVGKVRELKSSERYEVLVERFIPVTQMEGAVRLVLAEADVRALGRALKQRQEGEVRVGWAHTHPGFGVFLSDFDKEQHQRLFPEPWQIAYVMDTQAQERAAYVAADDQWQRLEGYYILKEMAENEIVLPAAQAGRRWGRLAALAVVFVLIAGALVWGYNWAMDFVKPPDEPPPVVETSGKPPVVVNGGSSQPVEKEEEPPQSQGQAPAVEEIETETRSGEYIVQSGDNLWIIAEKLWGDPRLFPYIVIENDLEDPSYLPVGKVLLIPELPRN